MIHATAMLAALVAGDLPLEVVSLSGATVKGNLVAVADGALQVGEQQLPFASIRTATAAGAELQLDPAAITVMLRDETLIRCQQFTVSGGKARLQLGDTAVEASVNDVTWALLRPLDKEPEAKQQWQLLLDRPAEGDRLAYLRETDKDVSLEHFTGALFDVTSEVVDFQFGGDRVKPKRTKVVGLTYLLRPRELGDAVCKLNTTDGSVYSAASLKWSAGVLAVRTPAGVEAAVPQDKILSLEFGSNNLVYLSDLEPASVECEPYFGVSLESEREAYLPHFDEGFGGQPLKVKDRPAAAKGLALRSHTKITYRLQRPYKRLRATVGIAEEFQRSEIKPHAELIISDGKKTLLEREVAADEEPFELDLDVSGVQRLIVELQYGKRQDIADHVNLCNARLVK